MVVSYVLPITLGVDHVLSPNLIYHTHNRICQAEHASSMHSLFVYIWMYAVLSQEKFLAWSYMYKQPIIEELYKDKLIFEVDEVTFYNTILLKVSTLSG